MLYFVRATDEAGAIDERRLRQLLRALEREEARARATAETALKQRATKLLAEAHRIGQATRTALREAMGFQGAVSRQRDKLMLAEHLHLDSIAEVCSVCEAPSERGRQAAEALQATLTKVRADSVAVERVSPKLVEHDRALEEEIADSTPSPEQLRPASAAYSRGSARFSLLSNPCSFSRAAARTLGFSVLEPVSDRRVLASEPFGETLPDRLATLAPVYRHLPSEPLRSSWQFLLQRVRPRMTPSCHDTALRLARPRRAVRRPRQAGNFGCRQIARSFEGLGDGLQCRPVFVQQASCVRQGTVEALPHGREQPWYDRERVVEPVGKEDRTQFTKPEPQFDVLREFSRTRQV